MEFSPKIIFTLKYLPESGSIQDIAHAIKKVLNINVKSEANFSTQNLKSTIYHFYFAKMIVFAYLVLINHHLHYVMIIVEKMETGVHS